MAEPGDGRAPLPDGPHGSPGEELESAVRDLEAAFQRLVGQHRRLLTRLAEGLHPGMSVGALKAFMAVCRTGPLTPSALAEQLMLDRGQVSRMVRELEDAGLLRREPDPQDRRSALLSPTEEGRARLDAVRGGPVGSGVRARLARWDLDDVRTLSVLLTRFVDERAEDDHGPGGH